MVVDEVEFVEVELKVGLAEDVGSIVWLLVVSAEAVDSENFAVAVDNDVADIGEVVATNFKLDAIYLAEYGNFT
jgi:hypothetical protein